MEQNSVPRSSVLKRALLAILAAGFSLALCGLMIEGLARTVFDNGMDFDLEMWKYARDLKRVSAEPAIGHEHIPNASGFFMGVPVSINSIGLRNREVPPVADGAVRVMMLGDSLTFGWGVKEEDTPSRLLETVLNGAASGARKYEVINTGVGNYNSQMEVAYFLTKGYTLKPDVVVLNYFINDAEPTPRRHKVGWGEYSQAYVVLASAVDKISRIFLGRADWKAYYRGLYENGQPGWNDAQAAMQRLAQYCKENGIKLVFVNYPELHELKQYPFPEVTGAVEKIAASEGVPFLDLRPSVEDLVPETLWVSPADAHPNRTANERFAGAIAQTLTQAYPDLFANTASVATVGK
ncbi:SGNH/GDSL hydrolase family protein [Ensifer sp.]|jgi:lysophospholipase L1-like esterase|uniref:SGNH/GDSL hydrolase family protein n=1 Tax=Ensifer sp. TaxID=1872086 RepID=UPI002E12A78C|nr:SGNH/GDSL hydrolase family protein [Ensifer sp.]